MDDTVESKSKPENGKKTLKRKPSSLGRLDTQRHYMTWILAIIIISAYIVFFGWIISTAPITTDTTVRNVTKITIDYSGMESLTATFGIIVAAIVGYYFGQRNLEKAANIAQNATEIAKEAKDDAEVKKINLKNEKRDYVNEVDMGVPLYKEILDFISSDNVAKGLTATNEKEDLTKLKSKLDERIERLKSKSKTKKKELEVSETAEPGRKVDLDVIPY